jgi:hypothetical protein
MIRTCRPLRCRGVAWGKGPPSRHHLVANRWQQETCPLLAPWMPNKHFVEVALHGSERLSMCSGHIRALSNFPPNLPFHYYDIHEAPRKVMHKSLIEALTDLRRGDYKKC